jgi:hypothetical protein
MKKIQIKNNGNPTKFYAIKWNDPKSEEGEIIAAQHLQQHFTLDVTIEDSWSVSVAISNKDLRQGDRVKVSELSKSLKITPFPTTKATLSADSGGNWRVAYEQ